MRLPIHWIQQLCGRGLVIAGCWLLLSLTTSNAHAQYGSSFSYYNPRTGRGFATGGFAGSGSYYGGFSVVTPRYRYSTSNGYSGGNYRSSSVYANIRYGYAQRAAYGSGYYSGGTAYVRRRAPGVTTATAAVETPW